MSGFFCFVPRTTRVQLFAELFYRRRGGLLPPDETWLYGALQVCEERPTLVQFVSEYTEAVPMGPAKGHGSGVGGAEDHLERVENRIVGNPMASSVFHASSPVAVKKAIERRVFLEVGTLGQRFVRWQTKLRLSELSVRGHA